MMGWDTSIHQPQGLQSTKALKYTTVPSTPDSFPAELLGGSLLWYLHSLSRSVLGETEEGHPRLVDPTPRGLGSNRKARLGNS